VRLRAGALALLLVLTACAGEGASPAGDVAPLTPRQASLLAETLHRHAEAGGARFTLVALDEATGTTLTLDGVIDWASIQGRASVGGYADADGPVTEIAWTRDAVAELRPTPLELLALTGRKQDKRQAQWLRRYGWVFAVTAQGKVRVTRDYYRRRMCGELSEPRAAALPEPNFAHLGQKA
jgi:hypothetical protein